MAKKNTEENTTPGPLPGFGKMVKPPAGFDEPEKPAPKKRGKAMADPPSEDGKGGDKTPPDPWGGSQRDGGGRAVPPDPTPVATNEAPIATAKKTRKPRQPKIPAAPGAVVQYPEVMSPVTTAVGKLKAKILARDAKYAALEQRIAEMKTAHEDALVEARSSGFDAGYKKGIKDAAEHLKELS